MNPLASHDVPHPQYWEGVSLTLDRSVSEQSYIKDRPVACHSLAVSSAADEGDLSEFNIDAA
jgi:hypothetical protein